MEHEIWFMMIKFLECAYAADRFCKSCLEITKRKEILFILLLGGGWGMMRSPMKFVLPVALVLVLFRGSREKKLLVASVMLATITLAVNFCDSLLSCFMLVWLHTVKKIPEPFMTAGMLGTIDCVTGAAVIFLLCKMSGRLAGVFAKKAGKWYVTLAVPLFALTAIMALVNWGAGHGILVRGAEEMGLYYDQIFSHLYIILLCALSAFGAVSFVAGMNRIDLEQRKNAQYQAQIAAYRMLEEQYERAERLRHDMKNHLIALTGLLEDRAWEKMDVYLKKMKAGGNLESGGDLTGNQVVDALLYNKWKKAKAEHISWECDVRMPKVCGIDEFDLCVLFGNILDNAIEACEKLEDGQKRFIDIRAGMVKSCFLLEVKNSADTAGIQGQEADGREHGRIYAARHTKANGKEHGIGLLNINDMVQQYQGVINRECGKGTYTVSVLLPFEKNGNFHRKGDFI